MRGRYPLQAVKPFGDLGQATSLVIGHDPRLQRSNAKAEVAFFIDHLPSATSSYSLLRQAQHFNHREVPVIPIVHVKQWPLTSRFTRHAGPMETAKRETRLALS